MRPRSDPHEDPNTRKKNGRSRRGQSPRGTGSPDVGRITPAL